MPMHARDVYPILYSFKADGDTATVKSLQLWTREYHLEPPQTAANDNDPAARPVEWETNVYERTADELVAAYRKDEKHKEDLNYEPQYSAAMHEESHHPAVRRAAKAMPIYEVDAEDEVIRAVDAAKMRDWLGSDAIVMDMAVEPRVTFGDVGNHIGVDADEAKREIKDIAATFYERAA